MAAVAITPADLAPFAVIDDRKAQAMIDDAMARAALYAPCIVSSEFDELKAAAAKAIIREAILRRNEAGSGALTQEQTTTGPFAYGRTIDTRTSRTGMFEPAEIDDLKAMCSETNGGAFSINTAPTEVITHTQSCSIYFGQDCSCGAVLTQGLPLWG